MPTIGAILIAGLAAWIVEGWLAPYLGVAAKAAIGLVVWLAAFWATRKWLSELRGD